MLVISVIVVAVVASAYVFIPEFQQGVADLSSDVSTALATGSVNGVGFDRAGGNTGGGTGPGVPLSPGANGGGDPNNAGHHQRPPPRTHGG